MARNVFVPGMAAPVRLPSPTLAVVLMVLGLVMLPVGILMIVFGAGPQTETVERPGLLALGIVTVVLALAPLVTAWILIAVITYKHSSDLQRNRARPFDMWELFFWLGLLLVGPLMLVVYWVNLDALNELRRRAGLAESATPIVAFVFAIILGPVGAIIWYYHHKGTMEEIAARGHLAPLIPPQPPVWQTAPA